MSRKRKRKVWNPPPLDDPYWRRVYEREERRGNHHKRYCVRADRDGEVRYMFRGSFYPTMRGYEYNLSPSPPWHGLRADDFNRYQIGRLRADGWAVTVERIK